MGCISHEGDVPDLRARGKGGMLATRLPIQHINQKQFAR